MLSNAESLVLEAVELGKYDQSQQHSKLLLLLTTLGD
jgi:hypothetical protein